MEKPVITVKDLSMVFNLEKEKTDTLKEFVLKALKRQLMFQEFYALKNINLDIKKGESVALIGVNGSGKSTLLKSIAGVLYPSEGSVSVEGTIAPLIELGAGFDPELTARENVYLNGAVMGFDREFMNQRFQDIVDFSELLEFMDVPVKNFSSGMIARLGFAIATIVSADILLVDEILSVGDYNFQKKCEARMRQLLSHGTTLMLVSHSGADVVRTCQKAVWLDKGRIIECGPSEKVYQDYIAFLEAKNHR